MDDWGQDEEVGGGDPNSGGGGGGFHEWDSSEDAQRVVQAPPAKRPRKLAKPRNITKVVAAPELNSNKGGDVFRQAGHIHSVASSEGVLVVNNATLEARRVAGVGFNVRRKYKGKTGVERLNTNVVHRDPDRCEKQKIEVKKGRKNTPHVFGGMSKKLGIRATVLCLLRRSRDPGGVKNTVPVQVESVLGDGKGIFFSIHDPLEFVKIIFQCLSSLGPSDEKSSWDLYSRRMVGIASRLLAREKLEEEEDNKIWKSFQALLRNSEIYPANMRDASSFRARPGESWILNPSWYCADDVVRGYWMDFNRWGDNDGKIDATEDNSNATDLVAWESSPYGSKYVSKIKKTVDRMCHLANKTTENDEVGAPEEDAIEGGGDTEFFESF